MSLMYSTETHQNLLSRIPAVTGRPLEAWLKAVDDGPSLRHCEDKIDWLRREYDISYGYAKAHSGLSLEDFQKRITVQELTPAGLGGLGPTAQILARLEGLDAHAAAVTMRLAALDAVSRTDDADARGPAG